MQTEQSVEDQLKRLAEVLYMLPVGVKNELLESAAKYLVAEGRAEQLAFLFGLDDAQLLHKQSPTQTSGGLLYDTSHRRKRRIAFGWYGGKFSHLNWLLPLLPYTHHYCEPFGGSAAVLINRRPSPVETYNDIDGEVANFFRVLRDQTDELIKVIALTPFSREEFAVAIAKATDELPNLERARRFFVRARQVRTGLAQTASIGRWANCKETSRAGMAGVVSRWLGSIDDLPEIAERLLRVQIENRPAIEVIRLYDSKDTLFYCDPPYPHEIRGDIKSYRYEMSEEDHIGLAHVLRNIKGKVAISSYRCALMDGLYEGWRCVEAPEKSCHSVKKPRKEALWINY
jgi:DNA adenine methylase